MKAKTLLVILLPVIFTCSLEAQKKSGRMVITGTVHDKYESPIANAIIMVDNKKTGYVTDSQGNYKIRVRRNAGKLGFFTFGNGYFEVPIKGRSEINVSFSSILSKTPPEEPYHDGNDPVNLGYNQIKQKNLTNNISMIDGKSKDYSSYSSVSDMIQREVPGVRVTSSGVLMGATNMDGPVPAMILLDGVPVSSLESVKPSMVESINVLKDASASIYGSRAFGGVILIKTKTSN